MAYTLQFLLYMSVHDLGKQYMNDLFHRRAVPCCTCCARCCCALLLLAARPRLARAAAVHDRRRYMSVVWCRCHRPSIRGQAVICMPAGRPPCLFLCTCCARGAARRPPHGMYICTGIVVVGTLILSYLSFCSTLGFFVHWALVGCPRGRFLVFWSVNRRFLHARARVHVVHFCTASWPACWSSRVHRDLDLFGTWYSQVHAWSFSSSFPSIFVGTWRAKTKMKKEI